MYSQFMMRGQKDIKLNCFSFSSVFRPSQTVQPSFKTIVGLASRYVVLHFTKKITQLKKIPSIIL